MLETAVITFLRVLLTQTDVLIMSWPQAGTLAKPGAFGFAVCSPAYQVMGNSGK